MKKSQVLEALKLFHKKMEGHKLFTPAEVFKIHDTPCPMYKYFDKNDEAVACFSYSDFSETVANERDHFVELHFGLNMTKIFDYEYLVLLINNLNLGVVEKVLPTVLEYYGTPLNDRGHLFGRLKGECMEKNGTRFEDIPFNPENIVPNHGVGTVKYFRFGKDNEYAVCAIIGSCEDDRPGSKSVFWTTEKIKLGDLKDTILSIPIAKKIIEKMPFKVKW